MGYFPDVKSFDKLFNDNWKSLVYGDKSETWNEKMYSSARETWTEIFETLESRGRQLLNYWPLYAGFFVGSFIILVTYKSLRYVRTTELREIVKCEPSGNPKIFTEESRINSNDGNVDIDNSSQNTCSTSRLIVDDATASPTNDNYHGRPESTVSSDTAVIAVGEKQGSEFLKNFINSMRLGDDAIDYTASTKHSTDCSKENKEILIVPLIPSKDQELCDSKVLSPAKSMTTDNTKHKSFMQRNSSSKNAEPKGTIKNRTQHGNRVRSETPRAPTVNAASANDGKTMAQTTNKPADSTLAINHESSSICCADELLSQSSKTENYIFPSPHTNKHGESSNNPIVQKNKPDCNNLEVVFTNFVQKLPDLDLSPITREPENIENVKKITDPAIRTDSKQRCRSLSHDNKIASNVGYIDNRRGSSVSPVARNKNKQRFVTQVQSKIPTLNSVNHRTLQGLSKTDGQVEEAANQIRSVLLRKLKEVWEQYPGDKTPSPNRSLNSSHESSIYYTPECVSKIPLPRRSPRHVDANDHTISSGVDSQSVRSANHSNKSQPGYSGITNAPDTPDDASMIPLHSTPKISPFSRDSNKKR